MPPAALSLLIQLTAAALVWAVGRQWPLPLIGLAGLAGALACGLSVLTRQARWWWGLHLGFLPAVVAAHQWAVAPGWFLAGFLLLALINWNSVRAQVPLYLSNADTAQAVIGLLPAARPVTVIDAGCGTGSMIARIARARPDCRVIGFENAPLPWGVSRLRARGRCEVRFGDFWRQPFSEAALVYAFLSPVPMARLWEKCCAEMAAGSMLVSNTFQVPQARPDQVIELQDRRGTRLYCYRVPGRGASRRA